MLGDLLISCDKSSCSQTVALKNSKAHIDSGCRLALPTFSPSKMTVAHVAAKRCPDMEDMARLVDNKYGRALMLYSKCHELFNSSDRFSEEMLASLRKFPNLTILESIVLTVVINSY